MKILGIDTTTKSASCSILNENVYYTNSITNDITHSEKLLPIIHETLEKASLTLNDIDILAAINGPGSFTGIRIGLATVKAFAQVKEMNVFSISSIDLISYVAFKKSNCQEKYVLSLIDANNSRVYYGINKLSFKEGKIVIQKVLDVGNDLIEDVIKDISSKYDLNDFIITGNCIEKFSNILSQHNCTDLYPTTEDLIDCYLNIYDTDAYLYNAYNLDALYARPSQAERVANNG